MAGRNRKRNRFKFLTKKFPIRMQRKLVMLFMAVILAFVVLIGRITWINASRGSSYTKVVLDQQNYNSRVIAYKRGDIVDRNGTKLATSERVYNVILDVAAMTDNGEKDDYIEPTKAVLKECFGIEESVVDALIEEKPTSQYEILATEVDYETAQKFNKIDDDDKNYPNVRGIWLEDDYTRTYPYNSMASDVIGFVYDGNQGAMQEPFVIPKRVPRRHDGVFFTSVPAENLHFDLGMKGFVDFFFRSAGGFHRAVTIRILHGLLHEFVYFAGRDVVRERCIPLVFHIIAEIGLQCAADPFGYGVFGMFLHPRVERGVNLEAVPV